MEIAPVMPIHPHTSKPNAPTKFKKKRSSHTGLTTLSLQDRSFPRSIIKGSLIHHHVQELQGSDQEFQPGATLNIPK